MDKISIINDAGIVISTRMVDDADYSDDSRMITGTIQGTGKDITIMPATTHTVIIEELP